MKEQQMQYPVNVAKVNAGKVLEKDGYYCFMILGETDDTSENDDDAAKFAEKQIDIGVKAFDNYLRKRVSYFLKISVDKSQKQCYTLKR